MKKIALTALVITSLSAGAALAAEPFNDRGIDYVATVQPDPSVQRESITAQANNFNDRGVDYVEAAEVSTKTLRSDVNPVVKGFNNRGDVAVTTG
jgi:hypothetical protein